MRLALRTAVAAVVALAGSPAAAAAADVLEPGAAVGRGAADPTTGVAVIVRFAGLTRAPPLVADRATRRRALVTHLRGQAEATWRALAPLLREGGARDVRLLWGAGGVALTASPELLRRLAAHPAVASVVPDRTWRLPAPRPAPPGSAPWNLDAVGAPVLWQEGLTGSGVVVAIVDTGVDAVHPDLVDRWRGGPGGWLDPAGEHAAPADVQGHGTGAAGLVLGGAAGGTAIGVAPGARWMAAKIFDDSGATSFGALHASFQWLLDPDGDPATDDAPDVVNASWGLSGAPGECVTEFDADLDALRTADIVVVFAAGNDGPNPGTSVSPANAVGVLSVGAVDESWALLDASSRGPSACGGGVFPSLVGPGDGLYTADLTYGGVVPQPYAWVAGTSFAAPHVAGVAALLRQACPAATAEAVAAALRSSAVDLGPPGPDQGFGAGMPAAGGAWEALISSGACSGGTRDGGVAPDGATADDGGVTIAATDGGVTIADGGGPGDGGAAEGDAAESGPAAGDDGARARNASGGGCRAAPEAGGAGLGLMISVLGVLRLLVRGRERAAPSRRRAPR